MSEHEARQAQLARVIRDELGRLGADQGMTLADYDSVARAVLAEQADLRAEVERLRAEHITEFQRLFDADAEIERLRGEVRRLRSRIHEAVDECQRRFAPIQRYYDTNVALQREVIQRHDEAQIAKGEKPGTGISTYGVATTVVFAKERDAALATIERVKALIDPAAQMAQPLYGERYFCEADIRAALDGPQPATSRPAPTDLAAACGAPPAGFGTWINSDRLGEDADPEPDVELHLRSGDVASSILHVASGEQADTGLLAVA